MLILINGMGSLRKLELNDMIKKYHLKTFIEMGTGLGDRLFYASKHEFDDMDANYLEKIFHMGVKFDILLKENLLIDYNVILIGRIK